jgi:hypothetical protein
MNTAITRTQTQLSDFILNVAIVRPVCIWGPSGLGKLSLVQQCAAPVGLPWVSLPPRQQNSSCVISRSGRGGLR